MTVYTERLVRSEIALNNAVDVEDGDAFVVTLYGVESKHLRGQALTVRFDALDVEVRVWSDGYTQVVKSTGVDQLTL